MELVLVAILLIPGIMIIIQVVIMRIVMILNIVGPLAGRKVFRLAKMGIITGLL